MAKNKPDPFTFEAAGEAIEAELGFKIADAESATALGAAATAVHVKASDFRERVKELELKRFQARDRMDGASVTGIDERLLVLHRCILDLEGVERSLHERGKEARDAESKAAAPGLLKALKPLADALEKKLADADEALAALQFAAAKCSSAWASIPAGDVPPRSEADHALVARVDGLLGGRAAGDHGREYFGASTRFALPNAPRDPGEMTTIAVGQREPEHRTVNVRGNRGRVG